MNTTFLYPFRDMPKVEVLVDGEMVEYDLMSDSEDSYPNFDKTLLTIADKSYVNGVVQHWGHDEYYWKVKMKMQIWNKPEQRPQHGQRVVVINHGGKGAAVGRYDKDMDVWNTNACVTPHVGCDLTSHDIWWEDVTAWLPAPEVS